MPDHKNPRGAQETELVKAWSRCSGCSVGRKIGPRCRGRRESASGDFLEREARVRLTKGGWKALVGRGAV